MFTSLAFDFWRVSLEVCRHGWVLVLTFCVASYLAWLFLTSRQYKLRDALYSPTECGYAGGSHWFLGDLPLVANRSTVPCTNPPRKDMIGLFELLAKEAREEKKPLFRLRVLNRFVPFLCRDWCVLLDPVLTKELLSLKHYGDFAKGDSCTCFCVLAKGPSPFGPLQLNGSRWLVTWLHTLSCR